ncbi:ATP-binding protein [Anaerovorax odorimutans]|uniref:ATP-binding protein n=1 Tax=Anaerovorax odorimutans TaxID=109327 RepID=UPI0003F79FEC|nr:ATP-binding protein [Anaerovorax odorimutans]
MKQLLILSGKGGTGKTTVATSFIKLSNAKVFADCDVDAPNLHLLTSGMSDPKYTNYFGLPKAVIDSNKCIKCGLCKENCKFDAIENIKDYQVDWYACEGCGVCEKLCPTKAITLIPAKAGDLILYSDIDKAFSTAKLKMGSGTSGKLVTEVKKQMNSVTVKSDLAVIDGSPGIGCPVIASLSGVDMVLIVAEPSISGINDMERIITTAQKFHTKIAVCINKYNTNQSNTDRIIEYCKNSNIPFVGKIPFDKKAVTAINSGKSIVEIDCEAGISAKEVYKKTMDILFN